MKQVICYLYEYENNRQVRNVGFVKCMALQGKVVFEIHGKGVDCAKGRSLKMFLYMTKGACSKISEVGYVEGNARVVNYKMTMASMTSQELEEYDGIYLETIEEKRYVATWNQSPLILEQEVSANEVPAIEAEEDMGATEIEDAIIEEVEECVKREWEELDDMNEEISEEISADILVESDTIEQDKNNEEKPLSYEKIDRQGLSVLPQREWRVANNSFLLHGYYNYKHLLFIREGELLFLGVPGVYHAKEAEAARSFGFPAFHRVKQGRVELGANEWNAEADFGYWCRQVTQRGK